MSNTILQAKDVSTGKLYSIIKGTGVIFDYENEDIFLCTDDHEESQWADTFFKLEVENEEITFYLMERFSFEQVQEWSRVINILDMENDKEYMASIERSEQSDTIAQSNMEVICGPLKEVFGDKATLDPKRCELCKDISTVGANCYCKIKGLVIPDVSSHPYWCPSQK